MANPIVIVAVFQPLKHSGLASPGPLEAVKQAGENKKKKEKRELMMRMHLWNLNFIALHLVALN